MLVTSWVGRLASGFKGIIAEKISIIGLGYASVKHHAMTITTLWNDAIKMLVTRRSQGNRPLPLAGASDGEAFLLLPPANFGGLPTIGNVSPIHILHANTD